MSARPDSARRPSRSSIGGSGSINEVALDGAGALSASRSVKRASRSIGHTRKSSSSSVSTTAASQGSPKATKRDSRSKDPATSTQAKGSPDTNEGHNGEANDTLDNGNDNATEYARMSREQLLALVERERNDKQEIHARFEKVTLERTDLSSQIHELLASQELKQAKLQEAYDSAARFENQLASQLQEQSSLEHQLREAEKAQKRYATQVDSFETERTAWYTSEQALKEKLATLEEEKAALAAASIGKPDHTKSPSVDSNTAPHMDRDNSSSQTAVVPASALSPTPSLQPHPSPTFSIPQSALEELNLLNIRVAEVTSEHAQLTTEVQRLTAELEEVQRLNADLQEQNENYEALLAERVLGGISVGHFSDSGVGSSLANVSMQSSTRPLSDGSLGGSSGGRSRPTSSLGALQEDPLEDVDESSSDEESKDDELEYLEGSGDGSLEGGAVGARHSIIRRAPKRSDGPSESGDTTGCLNLEAELEKAAKEGEADKAKKEALRLKKEKKRAKAVAERRKANQSTHLGGREGDPISADVEQLRNEVRLLRQENKGLSTYVSKILERVIGMEGFEKVLAVDKDYRASPPMLQQHSNQVGIPSPVKTSSTASRPGLAPAFSANAVPPASPRPHPLRTQSLATSSVSSGGNRDARTSPLSPKGGKDQLPLPDGATPAGQKKGRFSMDFITSALWRGSSGPAQAAGTSGGTGSTSSASGPSTSPNPPPLPGFKPMMLNAAARRMSTEEDEDDQKTRARLQSEMKLLGYANHGSPVLHAGLGASSLNNAQPIQRNRSPSQRLSVGSATSNNLLSPRPPSLPPKDEHRDPEGSDSSNSRRVSGSADIGNTASPSQGGGGSVKLSGHRKRPSAGNKESATSEASSGLQSIGLGLSYSKDSASTWSPRSPSTSHQA